MTAAEVIALLDLAPHPEGGWYRQTFRDTTGPEGRGASTAIYFMLEAGQESRWHRVDAAEVWHFHAGASLLLTIGAVEHRLGADLAAGERPQAVVPTGVWQKARSLGDWTLVGCTVAPGFDFAGFEMAPEGWEPPISS
ncbi:MAG: cupin domain-containing protein [Caulobacter sp.]|nr:cupin domain-containing protein [Caulobacter sp.]